MHAGYQLQTLSAPGAVESAVGIGLGGPVSAAWVVGDGRLWQLGGDRLGRARDGLPAGRTQAARLRLARLGARAATSAPGARVLRFEMTRRAPGICARQALRIDRARVLGGGRLRVVVTRRARLRIIALREDRGHLLPVRGLRPISLRRGANTVRVRGLARGRHRLQLTAGARGAQAGYALLSFRR